MALPDPEFNLEDAEAGERAALFGQTLPEYVRSMSDAEFDVLYSLVGDSLANGMSGEYDRLVVVVREERERRDASNN